MAISSSSSDALSRLPANAVTAINKSSPFLNLPRDLILLILSKLPPTEALRTGRVCTTLRSYSRDNIIWKRYFQHTFPLTKIPPSHLLWKDFATHTHLVKAAINLDLKKEGENRDLLPVNPSNLPQTLFWSRDSDRLFSVLDSDTDTSSLAPISLNNLAELEAILKKLYPEIQLGTAPPSAFILTNTHMIMCLKIGFIFALDRNTTTLSCTMKLAGENPQMCISPTNPDAFFILTTDPSGTGVQLDAYEIHPPDTLKHSKKIMEAECGYLLGSDKHLVCLTWPKSTTETGHKVTITNLTNDKTLTTLLTDDISPAQFRLLTNGHLMIIDNRRMLYVDLHTMDIHEISATAHSVDRIFGQTAGGEVLLTGEGTSDFKVQSWRFIENRWTLMQTAKEKFNNGASLQSIGNRLLFEEGPGRTVPVRHVRILSFAVPDQV